MSPKPSRVSQFPLEPSGVAEDLIFGEEGRPSLVLSKSLLAQIWAQVSEGTRMLTRGGGLEVGGLLVGPKVRGGKVVVEEIVPLPIDYELGPSYQMSRSDLDRIAPAIESFQGDESKLVVGFYRSRTRGDGTLRESDLEIVEAVRVAHPSFDADFRSCLVLAPVSESVALACIAMRYAGGWHEMQPFTLRSNPLSIVAMPPSNTLQPIPRGFHSEGQVVAQIASGSAIQPAAESRIAESRGGETRGETRIAERRATEQRLVEHRLAEHRMAELRKELPPAEQPDDEDAEPFVKGGERERREKFLLYLAASLVALLVGTGIYRWANKKQPTTAPVAHVDAVAPRIHLGFSATREGPVWKLSWDRAAMDALNPIGAVLSIQDGGYQQQVPLAPPDLASGTLFYTPQSSDLTFSLRIDRGGSQVEENVRVLEAPKVGQRQSERAQSIVGKAPIQTPPTGQVATADTSPVPAAPAKPAPRTFTPPPATAVAPAADPTVPQPPAVVLAVPVPPAIGQRANLDAAPRPVPVAPPPEPVAVPATPVVAANTNPAPSTTSKGPAPAPPAAAPAPPKVNYAGPKPIQQVRPQVPSNMPSGVSQVQVMVEIDAGGKVTKVTPVGWTSTNAPLMRLAVRAASSWVFDPAQLNGHNIPSEMSLIFRF